jgi:putative cell wall-binding protein/Tol biopolymer transport system component
MTTRTRSLVLALVLALLLVGPAGLPAAGQLPSQPGTGVFEAISVNPDGALLTAGGPSISADGRYVAFSAPRLQGWRPPGSPASSAYVRDRSTGQTERIRSLDAEPYTSVAVGGLSGDGRFALLNVWRWLNPCPAAAPCDTADVYVHDRVTRRAELISATPRGAAGNGRSYLGGISDDGRMVVFTSWATDLVSGDTNRTSGVFVRDRVRSITTRISVSPLDGAANISGDGRVVVFSSSTTNPTAGPRYIVTVAVHDLQRGTTEVIGRGTNEDLGVGLSGDGRYVVFNDPQHAYVRDRVSGRTEQIDVAADGQPADQPSYQPTISSDGRVVAFASAASNLSDAAGLGGDYQLYLRNRESGETRLVTVGPDGVAFRGWTVSPALNRDGTIVAFESWAAELGVPEYGQSSVFVWEGQTEGPPSAPSAPRQVTAQARDGAALVAWIAPWNLGSLSLDRYVVHIDRADGQAAGVAPVTVDGTTTTATIGGLDNGVGYRFTVTATNALGESPPSDPSNLLIPRPPPETLDRLAGADRYATAAAVSEHSHPDGAAVAYVATGSNYPDALAGAVTAVRDGGPVLLAGHDVLPEATATELRRLSPERIVVLGGPSAVSPEVGERLEEIAPVTRIAGRDRYATAAHAAAASFPEGADVVYVATGRAFPDALVAASLAAGPEPGPILLVGGNDVPPSTAAELARLAPQRIVILGGPEAVPSWVEDAFAQVAPVERLAGPNRYSTAAAVAARVPAGDTAYLATGENHPDALVSGAAAAATGSPLLLVTAKAIPEPTDVALGQRQVAHIHVVGGSAAVHDTVLDTLAQR